MSENWDRAYMVRLFGEAGADAMLKLSDAYNRIDEAEAIIKRLIDFSRIPRSRRQRDDLNDARAFCGPPKLESRPG